MYAGFGIVTYAIAVCMPQGSIRTLLTAGTLHPAFTCAAPRTLWLCGARDVCVVTVLSIWIRSHTQRFNMAPTPSRLWGMMT